jgi:hypothetical protein
VNSISGLRPPSKRESDTLRSNRKSLQTRLWNECKKATVISTHLQGFASEWIYKGRVCDTSDVDPSLRSEPPSDESLLGKGLSGKYKYRKGTSRTPSMPFPGTREAVDILSVIDCKVAEGVVGHETEGGESLGCNRCKY